MSSLSQRIIAALYKISNEHEFFTCDEPVLIERIMDMLDMPMNGEHYRLVRSHLFTSIMTPVMKKLGVEFSITDRQQVYRITYGKGVKLNG